MEMNLEKTFEEKACVSDRSILNRFFIYDDEIYFHVEKIPIGLNFIDVIRFKKLIYTSIDGFVATSYKVKEYLIFIYVKYAIKNRKSKVLLIEKIELLKNVIDDQIISEIWIIKDEKYKAVGMFNNYPVFFMIFNSNYDVNESLEVMIDNLNQYSKVINIRFFGCSREDFLKNEINTIEYSESFMANIIQNEISLDKYCEKNCIMKSKLKPANIAFIFVSSFINIFSFGLYIKKERILERYFHLQENIYNISNPISKKHYSAIIKTLKT